MSRKYKISKMDEGELIMHKKKNMIVSNRKRVPTKNGKSFYLPGESLSIWREDEEYLYLPLNYGGKKKEVKKDKIAFPDINFEPRDYQIKTILNSKEILRQNRSLLLQCCPGYGKTMISILLSYTLKYKTLILINRNSLIASWKNSIIAMFGDNSCDVIDGDATNLTLNAPFCICMAQQYYKVESVREEFGTLIVDEGHLFCTKSHISPLLYIEPKFLIWCSATPDRMDGMEKICNLFIPENARLRIFSKRPYNFNVIHTNVFYEGSNWHEYCKTVHTSDLRNEIVYKIAEESRNKKLKVMILTTTQKHTEELHEEIDSMGIGKCVKYYKSLKNVENYDLVIGTMPKISVGYDEAMACRDFDGIKSSVLIICTTMKSVNLFEQTVGRVMRSTKPNVFWLLDDSNISRNHIKGIVPYLKRSNGFIKQYFHTPEGFRDSKSITSSKLIDINYETVDYDGPHYIDYNPIQLKKRSKKDEDVDI